MYMVCFLKLTKNWPYDLLVHGYAKINSSSLGFLICYNPPKSLRGTQCLEPWATEDAINHQQLWLFSKTFFFLSNLTMLEKFNKYYFGLHVHQIIKCVNVKNQVTRYLASRASKRRKNLWRQSKKKLRLQKWLLGQWKSSCYFQKVR